LRCAATLLEQPINPLERGHIAFRTDDIDGIKQRLTERGVPYALCRLRRMGIEGWYQYPPYFCYK
jgi:hypothetical protein